MKLGKERLLLFDLASIVQSTRVVMDRLELTDDSLEMTIDCHDPCPYRNRIKNENTRHVSSSFDYHLFQGYLYKLFDSLVRVFLGRLLQIKLIR